MQFCLSLILTAKNGGCELARCAINLGLFWCSDNMRVSALRMECLYHQMCVRRSMQEARVTLIRICNLTKAFLLIYNMPYSVYTSHSCGDTNRTLYVTFLITPIFIAIRLQPSNASVISSYK